MDTLMLHCSLNPLDRLELCRQSKGLALHFHSDAGLASYLVHADDVPLLRDHLSKPGQAGPALRLGRGGTGAVTALWDNGRLLLKGEQLRGMKQQPTVQLSRMDLQRTIGHLATLLAADPCKTGTPRFGL